MTEKEFRASEEDIQRRADSSGKQMAQSCSDIDDPVRRQLCKVCGVPILGEAPFCKDHEYPVP